MKIRKQRKDGTFYWEEQNDFRPFDPTQPPPSTHIELPFATESDYHVTWGHLMDPEEQTETPSMHKHHPVEQVKVLDFIFATVLLSAFLVYGIPEIEKALFWFYHALSWLL